MTDDIMQKLSSEDGKFKLEVLRSSNGTFHFLEFKWVPYDEEFQEKLGRKGDWHMGQPSGLFETEDDCIGAALLVVPWMTNCDLK